MLLGYSLSILFLYLYPTQIFIGSIPSKTSILVRANLSSPFTLTLCRTTTASNQPHLLGLPVVAPNSLPLSRSIVPVLSVSSVGNGPSPTRVVYALTTPSTLSILVGPTPVPTHAPPAVGFDEVT